MYKPSRDTMAECDIFGGDTTGFRCLACVRQHGNRETPETLEELEAVIAAQRPTMPIELPRTGYESNAAEVRQTPAYHRVVCFTKRHNGSYIL